MSKHKMLQISTNKMATDKTRWKVFGAWLKTLREQSNLSQEGLGDKIGVDRQTIYRIEGGISGTKRETVIALAKHLPVTEEEALIKAGFAPQDITNDTFDILDGVKVSFQEKKFSKAEKERIVEIMRTLTMGIKAENENQ